MEETINNQIFTNSIIDLKDSIFKNDLENTKIYVQQIEDSYQKNFLFNDLNLQDLLELTNYNDSAVYAANKLDYLIRYSAMIEELKSIKKSEYWNEFEWQNFIKEVEQFGRDGIIEFLLNYLTAKDFQQPYNQKILKRVSHTYDLIDILPHLKELVIERLNKQNILNNEGGEN